MDFKVRVIDDDQQIDPGFAWIVISGPGPVPFKGTFQLVPGDELAPGGEGGQWPSGSLKPSKVERRDRQVRLLIGPEIVGHAALLPGTPVRIVLDETAVSADVVWPVLTLPMRSKRQRLVGTSARKASGPRSAASGRAGRRLIAPGYDGRFDTDGDVVGAQTGARASDRNDAESVVAAGVTPAIEPRPDPLPGEPAALVAGSAAAGAGAAAPTDRLAQALQKANAGAAARSAPGETGTSAPVEPQPDAPSLDDQLGAASNLADRTSAAPASRIGRVVGAGTSGDLTVVADETVPAFVAAAQTDVGAAAGMAAKPRGQERRGSYTAGFVVLIGLVGALLGALGNLAYVASFGVPETLQRATAGNVGFASPHAFLMQGEGVSPAGQRARVQDVSAIRERADAVVRMNAEEGAFWLRWATLTGLRDDQRGLARAMTDLGNALALQSLDGTTLKLSRAFWELGWAGGDCGALRNLATVHYGGAKGAEPLDAAAARPWLKGLIASNCPQDVAQLGNAGPAAQLFGSELPAASKAPGAMLGGLYAVFSSPQTVPAQASLRTASARPSQDQIAGTSIQEMLANADQALFEGQGEKSRSEAEFWLRHAVARQLGRPDVLWALTQLGSLQARRASTPQDYAQVHQIWELASALGDPVATCFLAELHRKKLIAGADAALADTVRERAEQTGQCS